MFNSIKTYNILILSDPHCQTKVWVEMKGCNNNRSFIRDQAEVKQNILYELRYRYYLTCVYRNFILTWTRRPAQLASVSNCQWLIIPTTHDHWYTNQNKIIYISFAAMWLTMMRTIREEISHDCPYNHVKM